MDFQHRSFDGYNFLVAVNQADGEFHGVLGLISEGFYAKGSIQTNDNLWLALWMVDKERAQNKSLGLELLQFAEVNFRPHNISAIGINKSVVGVYRLMGFSVETMNHWFIPNYSDLCRKLIIGAVHTKSEPSNYYTITILTEKSHELVREFLVDLSVTKDFDYLRGRYLMHPAYNYELLGVFDQVQKLIGVCVGREVSAQGSRAFRITDLFAGCDFNADISYSFQPFLRKRGYEYVDFLEFGFRDEYLISLGFTKCTDSLFVPHLFEPFVAERTSVRVAFKTNGYYLAAKGDSDLDRPNVRKNNV
jgi:hypothetical protein